MTLRERIRERRETLGLSKSEVARRTGISRQAYDNIEEDGADLKTSTLEALAAALGTTVGALLGETELPLAPQAAGEAAGEAGPAEPARRAS